MCQEAVEAEGGFSGLVEKANNNLLNSIAKCIRDLVRKSIEGI